MNKNEIKLLPFENFKTDVVFPTQQTMTDLLKVVFSPYIDGYLIRKLPCDCELQTLMCEGCQCGGC